MVMGELVMVVLLSVVVRGQAAIGQHTSVRKSAGSVVSAGLTR
jgi:hypothetical protein